MSIEEQGEGAAEWLARQLGQVERRLAHAETALRKDAWLPFSAPKSMEPATSGFSGDF